VLGTLFSTSLTRLGS